MATPAHAQLLDGALSSLAPPLLDSHLSTLALVVGPTMLLDALDLVDKRSVARITTPAGAPVYQVAASSSSAAPGGSYTVYLDLLGGGYCPCAFFSSAVLAPGATAVICKHLLACRIADRLDAWHDKRVGLKWVAGFATRFGAATPEAAPAGAGSAQAGAGGGGG
ncbi:hypothetical protein JCM8208_002635 [Rhodotorula glutinis]